MAKRVKVQKVGESLMVSIPKPIAELLDINKADNIYWIKHGDDLILSKEEK